MFACLSPSWLVYLKQKVDSLFRVYFLSLSSLGYFIEPTIPTLRRDHLGAWRPRPTAST